MKVRYTLFHQEAEQALGMLEESGVRSEDRRAPEIVLVWAETLAALGNNREAVEMLQPLLQGPTPAWIKVEARRMLEELRL